MCNYVDDKNIYIQEKYFYKAVVDEPATLQT